MTDQIRPIAGKQLPLRRQLRARRQLKRLAVRLAANERVMYLTTSSRGGRYGLLAATDRRVLILRGKDESEDIAYRNVTAFESGRERRKPFIRFRTDAGDIVVRGLSGSVDELCRHVHARMWDLSYHPHTERPALTVVPAANVA